MNLVYTDKFICHASYVLNNFGVMIWITFWIIFMFWIVNDLIYCVPKRHMSNLFLPYIARHILCGKIVCRWTHSQIVPVKTFDVQYTYLGGHICLSAYLRNETQSSEYDFTQVHNGTICGQNKVNKNFTLFHIRCLCVWVSVYECVCAWERKKVRDIRKDEVQHGSLGRPWTHFLPGQTESSLRYQAVPPGERDREREGDFKIFIYK